MAFYSDIVIGYNEQTGGFCVAGFNRAWDRAMIISDQEIPAALNGKTITCISPGGALREETLYVGRRAENAGIRIGYMVNEALAAAEFYRYQKEVTPSDKDLIVVSSHKGRCEISHVRNGAGEMSVNRTQRVEEAGEGSMKRILYETARMLRRKVSGRAVIILTGEMWKEQKVVLEMEHRFEEYAVLSYKADTAAMLGAVIYANRYLRVGASAEIPDQYVTCHYRRVAGAVDKLSPELQKAYRDTLRAVLDNEKYVVFEGGSKELLEYYHALSIDHPEVCILWDYQGSRCWAVTVNGREGGRLEFKYKTGGKALLERINRKADEILRACLARRSAPSDFEIICRLYLYMSEHYSFTKEKDPNGKYPSYSHTLETLLKSGICHGYAISMIYLLRRLQIPVLYMDGDADGIDFGGHAWNMIQKTDGSFRHMDVTWDLGRVRRGSVMKHFLLDDIAMRARKHFWCAKDYPACI